MSLTQLKICPSCNREIEISTWYIEYHITDDWVCNDCLISKEKNSPQEIIIKSEALDSSALSEGAGTNQYRPSSLEDYVGQEKAKERILGYLKGCKEHNDTFPHTFLSAPPGHGKTLLSEIIANMIGKPIAKCTGGELKNPQNLIDKIVESKNGIVFIDEANRINKTVGFFMLPVIEKFEVDNKKLKPFTVILATTHLGDISKDLDALVQRCDLKLELEHYNSEQLIQILKRYNDKQYPETIVSDAILQNISLNCRQTPRIARALLREYIYIKDWEKVRINNRIVKDGLTEVDIKALNFLSNVRGASKNTIANVLRIKPITYEMDIEPYLIFKELITIESRRKITNKGKEFLKQIN